MIYRFNIALISFKPLLVFSWTVIVLMACSSPALESIQESEMEPPLVTSVHVVDAFLDNCLSDSTNYTTQGMTQCTYDAIEKWESHLDSVVMRLNEVLSGELKILFTASQTAWEIYRDEQFEFSNALFSQSSGTMYIPIRASKLLDVIRERALVLSSYLREAEMYAAEQLFAFEE